MSNRPIDQQRRDTRRLWPALRPDLRPPAQPSYLGYRPDRVAGRRRWADLDALPANDASRRHLGTH